MTGAARYCINPFREPLSSAGDTDDARRFHESLSGYAPTPLLLLDGLAASLGLGRLYLKDEARRFGLNAFKALGASWAVQRLRDAGARLDTVATATDGNHGRAVAWVARIQGLRARVFIPAGAAAARVRAIEAEGADVVLVDGTYDEAVARCAARSAEAGWQVVADVGYGEYLEIPRWISEGYGTIFGEVRDQLKVKGLPLPDVVIIQAGVGGLAAAAVNWCAALESRPVMAVIEPVEADPLFASASSRDGSPTASSGRQDSIMAGLNCGLPSLAAWPVVRSGVGVFVAIEDRWAEKAMRTLARPIGDDPRVVAGESGAAGLAGVLALLGEDQLRPAAEALQLGPASRVLVINTEGATDPVAWHRIVGESP
jgi:diaminopropionate ammonia-lyase